jgi:hypothetical protein
MPDVLIFEALQMPPSGNDQRYFVTAFTEKTSDLEAIRADQPTLLSRSLAQMEGPNERLAPRSVIRITPGVSPMRVASARPIFLSARELNRLGEGKAGMLFRHGGFKQTNGSVAPICEVLSPLAALP